MLRQCFHCEQLQKEVGWPIFQVQYKGSLGSVHFLFTVCNELCVSLCLLLFPSSLFQFFIHFTCTLTFLKWNLSWNSFLRDWFNFLVRGRSFILTLGVCFTFIFASPVSRSAPAWKMSIPGQPVAQFAAWDYVVFILMLLVSVSIGVYHAIKARRQQSNQQFLLGGREMRALPVAMSLTASFMSAVTVIGTPSEVYRYGAIFLVFCISYTIVAIASAEIFLPIFYRLNITSTYEVSQIKPPSFFKCSSRLLSPLGLFISVLSLFIDTAFTLEFVQDVANQTRSCFVYVSSFFLPSWCSAALTSHHCFEIPPWSCHSLLLQIPGNVLLQTQHFSFKRCFYNTPLDMSVPTKGDYFPI